MRQLRLILTSLALLLGAGHGGHRRKTDDNAVELRIMTFNVWLGGEQVNIGRVYDAIRAAKGRHRSAAGARGPDARVCGHPRLSPMPASATTSSPSIRCSIRRPPMPTSRSRRIRPGRFVAVGDIHLTSDPYGPGAVRDGKDGRGGAEDRDGHAAAGDRTLHHRAVRRSRPAVCPFFIGGDFQTRPRTSIGRRPW